MQSKFAAALLDSSEGVLLLLDEPVSFDRERRFSIYRNNVQHSLIEALAASFPVTRELVGAQAFTTLAALFIRTSPPMSPYLVEYGDRLPDFLASRTELRDYPFLAEVARLEFQLLQSTHAADGSAIHGELMALADDPDRLLGSRFEFAAPTALLSLRCAAATIWLAHQQPNPDLAGVDKNRFEWALISRPGLQAELDLLDYEEFQFVSLLVSGATVDSALDAVGGSFDLTACLHRLLTRQVLIGVSEVKY